MRPQAKRIRRKSPAETPPTTPKPTAKMKQKQTIRASHAGRGGSHSAPLATSIGRDHDIVTASHTDEQLTTTQAVLMIALKPLAHKKKGTPSPLFYLLWTDNLMLRTLQGP